MTRKNRLFLVLATILLFAVTDLSAQLGTTSPYSMYGLGEINEAVSGRTAGMGGVGIGMRSTGLVNHINPASYTAFDTLSFVLDVSVSGKSSEFRSGGESEKALSANLYKLAFGFRVTSKWATSMGIMPYSSVGYSIESEQPIEGRSITNTTHYKGSGGLTRILFGNAFQVIPGLSVGVNTSFIFGSVMQTEQQGSWDIEKTLRTHKLFWDFGVQYQKMFKQRAIGVIGAVYGYHTQLSMTRNVDVISYYNTLYSERLRSQTMDLPSYAGIGASYARRNNVQFAAEYMFKKWSVMGSSNGAAFKDTHTVRAGASIIPNAQSPKTYFDMISYQAGVSVGNAYLSFNGENAMQASFNLGVGLPISSSVVDVVYSYGFIGKTGYKQLQEKFHKITIGLTLRETWFYKFLYQ